MYSLLIVESRVFSRDVVLGGGGIAFVGREQCEKYPKKKQVKFVTVWGGNSKLRGGNFPP